jgi:hypothetical protein
MDQGIILKSLLGYEMDDWGSISGRGRDFFSRGKAAGHEVDYSTPS